MTRVAVFVDAGYVFAQGSALLSGKKLPRGQVCLDHEAAAQALAEFARELAGAPLLRIYWYDGTSTGPTPKHLALARLDDVKVRLGFINSAGEQKGVDSLIVTDMITLDRNHAMSDAVLLSGDEDLRVGVQQAQELGVRVHLVGIKPSRGNQSLFLVQEADTTHEWNRERIAGFLTCKTQPVTASPPELKPPDSDEPLDAVASWLVASLDRAELLALTSAFEASRQVPKDLDARLLTGGRTAIGRDLSSQEKKRLRNTFIELCRQRLGV